MPCIQLSGQGLFVDTNVMLMRSRRRQEFLALMLLKFLDENATKWCLRITARSVACLVKYFDRDDR